MKIVNLINSNPWFCIFLCVAILVCGLLCDKSSETFELELVDLHLVPDGTKTPPPIVKTVREPERVAWQRAGSNLLYTIGISLFVSVVLIKGLEDGRRKQQDQAEQQINAKIRQNVFDAVLGKDLPPEIWWAVKRYILGPSVVVTEGTWDLFFSEEGGKLKLDTTISYTVFNFSHEESVEKRSVIVKPTSEGGMRSLDIKGEGITELHFSPASASVVHEIKDGADVYTYELRVPDQKDVKIITKYEDFYPMEGAIDVMFTYYPTKKLDISVRYPKGWTFDLQSFANSPIIKDDSGEETSHYHFTESLLPCQGVSYSLKKIGAAKA